MSSDGAEDNQEEHLVKEKINKFAEFSCLGIIEFIAVFSCAAHLCNEAIEYGQAEQFDKEIQRIQKFVEH